MDQANFFDMEPINSAPYWKKRVSDFIHLKGTSKRERESFYLEFFISAYLDNKSRIARKLGVPFTEVIFDNPNAPIIQKIVQQYKFYDEKELKRVSEGFFHYFRLSQFWNEYWAKNFTVLSTNIDKRFLTRCALTFLTLSYPASYSSYLERNSQSLFILFDDRVKGLGFSSVAKLLECSYHFCRPETKLAFPWDPRNQDNPNLIWNREGQLIYFEDFKEVLGNFLRSGYSMRHEDYSLLTKIENGVLPIQYSWRRNSTNETLSDKHAINRLLEKYSQENNQAKAVATFDVHSVPIIENSANTQEALEQVGKNPFIEQIIIFLETTFIIEDLLLNKVLPHNEKNDKIEALKSELKSILPTVTSLETEIPFDFLKLASNHLENLYIQLQETIVFHEPERITSSSSPEGLNDTDILAAFQEEKNIQALYAQIQRAQNSELQENPDSKYALLKEQYHKQGILLSDMIAQNRNLRDKLEDSISINSTKKVLSKYFSSASLDRLIEFLKKNG
jgi:hypothetical protein